MKKISSITSKIKGAKASGSKMMADKAQAAKTKPIAKKAAGSVKSAAKGKMPMGEDGKPAFLSKSKAGRVKTKASDKAEPKRTADVKKAANAAKGAAKINAKKDNVTNRLRARKLAGKKTKARG